MRQFLVTILIAVLASCTAKKEKSYEDKMTEAHKDDQPISNVSSESKEDIVSEAVVYTIVDNNEVTGYLAKPEEFTEGLPGIIVIHEWWGLNDNIRTMADKLADNGYVALAVDLYQGKVAETPENAKKYMMESMDRSEMLIENLKGAYAYLKEDNNVMKVGTIGWCFGGGWSLNTAINLPKEIDATVIYYGRLVTDSDKLEPLKMPILGIFGAEDQGIPVDNVRVFESVLNELDKDASIHIYEGANHAFANPSGTRYDKAAAEDAWEKTINFFNKNLK